MSETTLPTGLLTSAEIIATRKPEIAQEAHEFHLEHGRNPKLLIIPGDTLHDGSKRYMRTKKRTGSEVSVDVSVAGEDDQQDPTGAVKPLELSRILYLIDEANEDPTVDGIMLQLPLENRHKDAESYVLERILPTKDVDGLGRHSPYLTATATAIDWMLKGYNLDGRELRTVFMGDGPLSNTPLAQFWKSEGATQIQVFNRDSDELEKCGAVQEAQLIISAMGNPNLWEPGIFTNDATHKVLIDVGTAGTAKPHDGSQQGDFSDQMYDYVAERDWGITAKKGAIGPLTGLALVSTVVIAANAHAKKSTRPVSSLQATSFESKAPTEDDREFNPHYVSQ